MVCDFWDKVRNDHDRHCCFLKWNKVKITQLCPTPSDLMDCTVHEILQARVLERVAVPFSRGSSQTRDQTQVYHIAEIS